MMVVESILREAWGFRTFYEGGTRAGFLYDPPIMDSAAGPVYEYDGRPITNFSGINFLNWHQDPDMLVHFFDNSLRYGLVTGGSRMTQGISRPHAQLEDLVCQLTGKERGLTFASGLLANIGFVQAMSSALRLDSHCRIDNRDACFVLDRDSHWSLWKAVQHLPYGKQVFSFRHNDVGHLRQVLNKLPSRKAVVIVESVYSSDGSVGPLPEILDVCHEYGVLSFVDDANGFLVYGPENRPFAAEFARLSDATFIMTSFSKTVGLEGGILLGPRDVLMAFELLSGTSMFTAAIQPPTAATIHRIIRLLHDNPSIMDEYLLRVAAFRERLLEGGYRLNSTPSYITSIMIGADTKAVAIREAFLAANMNVPVFRYPAVKPNQALMRVILNRSHSDAQIDTFFETLEHIRSRVNF